MTFDYNLIKNNPNNRNIVLESVKQHGLSLQYASKKFKKDPEIVLEAIKNSGQALSFSLFQNKEIVLEAVKSYPDSLRWSLNKFKKDPEIVLEAIKRSAHTIEYSPLITNKEFIKEASLLNKDVSLYC